MDKGGGRRKETRKICRVIIKSQTHVKMFLFKKYYKKLKKVPGQTFHWLNTFNLC